MVRCVCECDPTFQTPQSKSGSPLNPRPEPRPPWGSGVIRILPVLLKRPIDARWEREERRQGRPLRMRVSGLSMDRRSLLLFVLLSASPLPRSAVGIHTSLSLSALAQPDPYSVPKGLHASLRAVITGAKRKVDARKLAGQGPRGSTRKKGSGACLPRIPRLLTLRGGLELRNTVDSSSGSEDSGLWDSGGGRGGGGPKGLDEDGLEFQTQEVTVNRQALMALDEPEVADAVMKVAPRPAGEPC